MSGKLGGAAASLGGAEDSAFYAERALMSPASSARGRGRANSQAIDPRAPATTSGFVTTRASEEGEWDEAAMRRPAPGVLPGAPPFVMTPLGGEW